MGARWYGKNMAAMMGVIVLKSRDAQLGKNAEKFGLPVEMSTMVNAKKDERRLSRAIVASGEQNDEYIVISKRGRS